MSLASKISALAIRLGREIKTLVRPEHPGLARAWRDKIVQRLTWLKQ